MARTALFSRLRALATAARRGSSPSSTAEALSRREFSQRALAGAVASLLAGCGSDSESDHGDSDESGGESPRVAIVGGGMAGLHCAFRLLPGIEATVYESSARTGGRMYTHAFAPGDARVAELGGELIDTGHVTLHMLAAELGLVLDDRLEGLSPEIATDVWWVDGVRVPEATVVEQFSAVAPAMAAAAAQADDDETAYDVLDRTPLSDWLDQNVPPAQYPELRAILEAAYRGEYGRELAEQSALNLLYLIGSDDPDPFRIFGESDERYHAHAGSQAFPDALAAALPAGRIVTERTLVRARDGEAGEIVLTFATPDGSEEEVIADHVVFALPFTRLRAVDLRGLTLSDEKRALIAELGYGTNVKNMARFVGRVWRTGSNALGSVTSDETFQQTWETTLGHPDGAGAVLTNFLGGQEGTQNDEIEPEAWWVQTVLPALEAILPGVEAAYLHDRSVRMHWPTYPHNLGSYACYRPGQWATAGTEGLPEGNLHFCGEHCSVDFQGYMEGAAETGAMVAMEILALHELAISPQLRGLGAVKSVVPQPCLGFSVPRRGRAARRSALARAWLQRSGTFGVRA